MRVQRVLVWLAFAGGCSADGSSDGRSPGSPDAGQHTGQPLHPPTPTDTAAPELCSSEERLELAVTAAEGPLATALSLSVEVGAPATVAALCTSDEDPHEEHLVESGASARRHELRFVGLLPDTTYTCHVAATCPMSSAPVEITHTTGVPSVRFPVLEVEVDPALGMTGSWTLAAWQDTTLRPLYLVIWGPDGRPRWWWQLPAGLELDVEALLDPEKTAWGGRQLLWGGGDRPTGAPTVVDLWEGATYVADLPRWKGRDNRYSHDTKRLPDGRILSLQVLENEARDRFDGFGVRIHDPETGHVDFEYDSQRLVDDGVLDRGIGPDPFHANWVGWYDTANGPRLYVSLFANQRILAIDGGSGEFLWEFGPRLGWEVVNAAGDPLPEEALPQGQHGLEVDGDELLVYDNGVDRFESRAERWRLDPVARTAQRLWVWTEPGFFEQFLGDVDDLGHGRVLVTQATLGNSNSPTAFVEVDTATNDVASRLTMPARSDVSYRGERYGGCELFDHVGECPRLADRREALRVVLP